MTPTLTSIPRPPLELLAPAKNLDFGIQALEHGADAVYIGGPSFGARHAAGNSVADIERLALRAHRYHARVYVALNTLLYDDELATAERLCHQLYEAGADALIVQDMGLLELDLPPLALHASTQTDNRSADKVRFLEQVGFSQVVLARELTLEQIKAIAQQTSSTLEFFIHGALCVSYSGQCYISQAQTGRSANRGECAQLCRLPYTLEDSAGQSLGAAQHLMSLKDMNQSANLDALIDAGITSFKIEGRLKDLGYVKNVTAYYRQALDRILEQCPELGRASGGHSTFSFTPDPDKSFNRGATDYFVRGRQADIGSWKSPKFCGTPIGAVRAIGRQSLTLDTNADMANGDGLCFFNRQQQLVGFRINRVAGAELFPAQMPEGLEVGSRLMRNGDRRFEQLLEKPSAERRIALDLTLSSNAEGLVLDLVDEDGIGARVAIADAKEPARQPEHALAALESGLRKLGTTHFVARRVLLTLDQPYFVSAATLNGLRRAAVEQLENARRAAYCRPLRATPQQPTPRYPLTALSYLGNVSNRLARAFYQRHGVTAIAPAFETERPSGPSSLMITRHCLRYSLGQCPKQGKPTLKGALTLVGDHQQRYQLHFDCKRCEMHVIGA